MPGNGTELRVPVRLDVLQDSVAQLQQVLNNLEPKNSAWKDLKKLIDSISKETETLSINLLKPFGSQKDFVAAEKSVSKIETAFQRAQNTIASIHFSDIKLTTSQQDELNKLTDDLNKIKSEVTTFKAQLKEDLKSSDLWADIEDIDKAAISHSFDQILKIVGNKVNSLQADADKAQKAFNKINKGYDQEKIDLTKKFFSNKDNLLSKETLGDDIYEQYFTKKGAFKSNAREQFIDWMKQNLALNESDITKLTGSTAKSLREALSKMLDKENILKKLEKTVTEHDAAEATKEDTNKKLQNAQKVLRELTASQQEVIDKENALEPNTRAAAEAIENFKTNVTSATQAEKQKVAVDSQLTASTDMVSQALRNANAEFLKAERITQTFNSIKSTIVNFMGFTQVLNLTKRAVKEALNHIQDLDSVMNKISIVTDMSTGDLWNQVDAYSKMAQTYGVSIKGAYEVSQIYYQQGLKTKDVLTLTNETLKLSKVSGLDYASTTDYMTTALRGFKMEMSEASKVVDVYSNLAAHTAVSQEELAIAMSKTASSMQSVGSTFEETSAMIGTMVAVTRESATNIGSALKSIAARYGEMKSNPSATQDIEGEALAYNKVDTALQSVGISMKTADGQFREFTDVIIELGEKWDQLESTQQRYIATQFAGNRQQSRFLALVSNVDLLKSNIGFAEDSEDTGTLQAIKALDSVESKLEQVKVAYQQFYTTMGVETMWKGALDGLKNYINYLNGLPKLFGKIPLGAIAVASNIVGILKLLGDQLITNIASAWKRGLEKASQETQKTGIDVAKEIGEQSDDVRAASEELGKIIGEGVQSGITQGMSQSTTTLINQAAEASAKVGKATASEQAAGEVPTTAKVQKDTSTSTAAKSSIETALSKTMFASDLTDMMKTQKVDFSNIEDSVTRFTQMFVSFAQDAQTAKTAFSNAGADAIAEYAQGILSNAGVAEEAAEVAGERAAAGFKLNQWLDQQIGSLILTSKPEDLIASLNKLPEQILEEARGPLLALGPDLSESIALGLLQSKGKVDDAAASVASSLVATLRSALNMHSPSPTIIAMFENGVGEAIALGLKASQEEIKSAASELGLTVSTELEDAFNHSKKINLSDYLEAGDAQQLAKTVAQKHLKNLDKQFAQAYKNEQKGMLENDSRQADFWKTIQAELNPQRDRTKSTIARMENISYEKIPVDYVVATHNLNASYLSDMASKWNGQIPSPSIAVRAMQDSLWSNFGNKNGAGLATLFMPRKYADPTLGHTNLYPGDAYTPMLDGEYETIEEARKFLDSFPLTDFDFGTELSGAIRDATHIPDLAYLRKILQNSMELPFGSVKDKMGKDTAKRLSPSQNDQYIKSEENILYSTLEYYLKKSGLENYNGLEVKRGAMSNGRGAFGKALYDTVDMMRQAESLGQAYDKTGEEDLLRKNLYKTFLEEAEIDVPTKFNDENASLLIEDMLRHAHFLEKKPGYDFAEAKSARDNIGYEELPSALVASTSTGIQGMLDGINTRLNAATSFFFDQYAKEGPLSHQAVGRYIINNVPGVAFNENGPLVEKEYNNGFDASRLKETFSQIMPEAEMRNALENNIINIVENTNLGQVLANTLAAGLSNIDFNAENATAALSGVMDTLARALRQSLSFEGLSDVGLDTARQIVAGMAIGLSSDVAQATTAAEGAGSAVIAALNAGAGVASPSIYAIQAGKFVMLGLEEGMSEEAEKAFQLAEETGQGMIFRLDKGLDSPNALRDILAQLNVKINDMEEGLEKEQAIQIRDQIEKGGIEFLKKSVAENLIKTGNNGEALLESIEYAKEHTFASTEKISEKPLVLRDDGLTEEQYQDFQRRYEENKAQYKSSVEPIRSRISEVEAEIQTLEDEAETLRQEEIRKAQAAHNSARVKHYESEMSDFNALLPEEKYQKLNSLKNERANLLGQKSDLNAIARKNKSEIEQAEKEAIKTNQELIRQQQEAERKAKEQAAQEAARKAEEEARKIKEEADRKAAEEAERRAKEEAARKAKEQAEQEAARKAKEEADRRIAEEAKKAAEEARKAKEEADRKAAEEAKRAEEEAARKAEEEAKAQAFNEAVNTRVNEIKTKYAEKPNALIQLAKNAAGRSDEELLGYIPPNMDETKKQIEMAARKQIRDEFSVKELTPVSEQPQEIEATVSAINSEADAYKRLLEIRRELAAGGDKKALGEERRALAAQWGIKTNQTNDWVDKKIKELETPVKATAGPAAYAPKVDEQQAQKEGEKAAETIVKAAEGTISEETISAPKVEVDKEQQEPLQIGMDLDHPSPENTVMVAVRTDKTQIETEVTSTVEELNGQLSLLPQIDVSMAEKQLNDFKAKYVEDDGVYIPVDPTKDIALSEDEYTSQLAALEKAYTEAVVNVQNELAKLREGSDSIEELTQKYLELIKAKRESGEINSTKAIALLANLKEIKSVEDLKKAYEELSEAKEDAEDEEDEEELVPNEGKIASIMDRIKSLFTENTKSVGTWGRAIGMGLSSITSFFDATTEGGEIAKNSIVALGGAISFVSSLLSKAGPMAYITAAITAVTSLINLINSTSLEARIARAEKQAEEFNNKAKEAKAEYKTLDNNLKKLDELQEKRYESAEATEEYQTAVDELAEKFPQLVAGFDEAGNVIIDTTSAERILSEARRESATATYDAAKKELEAARLKREQAGKDVTTTSVSQLPVESETYDIAGKLFLSMQEASGNSLTREWYEVNAADSMQSQLKLLAEEINDALNHNEGWAEPYRFLVGGFSNGQFSLDNMSKYLDNLEELSPIQTEVKNILDNNITLLVDNYNTAAEEYNNLISKSDADPEKVNAAYAKLSEAFNAVANAEILDKDTLDAYTEMISDASKKTQTYITMNDIYEGYQREVISAWQQSSEGNQKAWEQLSKSGSAAAIVTKQIQGIIGDKTWDEASKDSELTKQWREYQQTAANFLRTLSEDRLKLFNNMAADTSNFTAEDIIKEFNLDVESGFGKAIYDYYTDSARDITNRLNAQLSKALGNKANFQGKYKKIYAVDVKDNEFYQQFYDISQRRLSIINERYLNDALEQYQKLKESGYDAKAEQFGQNSLALFEEIEKLPYDIQKTLWASVEENGITTKEGLDNILAIFKNNKESFTSEAWAAVEKTFENLNESVIHNIGLMIETAVDNLLTNWEDTSKSLSSALNGGVSIKEADALIEKAKSLDFGEEKGISLDDFQLVGDKLVLTAQAYDRYYKATIKSFNDRATEVKTELEKAKDIKAESFIEEEFDANTDGGTYTFVLSKAYSEYQEALDSIGVSKQQLLDALAEGGPDAVQTLINNAVANLEERRKYYSQLAKIAQDQLMNAEDRKQGIYKIGDQVQSAEQLKKIVSADSKLGKDQITERAIKESVNGVYSTLLSDVVSKGIENINLDDYEGLVAGDTWRLNSLIKAGHAEELIKQYAVLAGKSLEEVDQLLAQNTQRTTSRYSTAIKEVLNYSSDGYISETTKSLGVSIKEIRTNSSYAIAKAKEFLDILATQIGKAGYTLSDYNAEAKTVLEQALFNNGGRERAVLEFASNNIDANSLETLANALGIQINDLVDVTTGEVQDFLANDLAFNPASGTYEIQRSFDELLDALNKKFGTVIAKGTKEYVAALKSFNENAITKEHEVDKAITEELKNVASAKVGDKINLAQTYSTLFSNLDEISEQALAEKFASLNASFSNGILTLESGANIQGIIQLIVDQAKSAGQMIPEEIAELKDAIVETLKNITNLINNGIEGSLSNVDKLQLENWAAQHDIVDLQFSQTADGFKLANESAIELYNTVRDLDSIQGQIVFEKLKDNLIATDDNFKSISSAAAHMAEVESELNEAIKDSETYDDTKIKQYEEELRLAREIESTRATTEDASFSFMSNKIPGGQNNPLNYLGDWSKAFSVMQEAGKDKNMIDYTDFYNIITEMGNLAEKSGEIRLSATQVLTNAEDAAALIEKGAAALSIAADGSIKVDLSKIGIDFSTGASDLKANVGEGIKEIANSQIKMLDSMIQLLETIVAMEELGDIDVEGNGIDFEEMFTKAFPDANGNWSYAWTQGMQNAAKNILDYADSLGKDSDLYKGLENVKVNGTSMRKIFEDAKNGILVNADTADAYHAAIAAFYDAMRSGDYNLDNIYESMKNILAGSGFEGEIQVGDMHLVFNQGMVFEKDEKGNIVYNGKTYSGDNALEDAKNAMRNDQVTAALAAFGGVQNEETGETTLTATTMNGGKIEITSSYNVETGRFEAVFSDGGFVSSDTAEGLAAAIQHYSYMQKMTLAEAEATTTSSDELTYSITKKGQVTVDWKVDVKTGEVETINPGSTTEEIGKALSDQMTASKGYTMPVKADTTDADTKISETDTALTNLANGTYSPTISVDNTGALNAISAVETKLTELDGKVVNTTVNTKTYNQVITSDENGAFGATGNFGLAKAKGTLMGELGPELVVQGSRYFVAGQGGPEFVDLQKDAIVFNHLQTEQLLKKGMSTSRGQAVTNERNAVAFAHGNINGGPAMASAKAALKALRQLRDQWKAIASMSAQDFAGLGGSGGGGGGGGDNAAERKAFIKDLEIWFNWLQRIAQLEVEINREEKKRSVYSSSLLRSGEEYAKSNLNSLKLLRQQAVLNQAMADTQQEYLDKLIKQKNEDNRGYDELYGFRADGQMYYKNDAFAKFAEMVGRDSGTGAANYTAEEQYNALVSMGFESQMEYDSSGNKIDKSQDDWYVSAVQAFWDKVDADKAEVQSLKDSIDEHLDAVLENQAAANEIMKEIEDAQRTVEDDVLQAITDLRQAEIDELQKERDALEASTSKVIDGLSDQLSKEKDMYTQQESADELLQMQRREAILRSGGGSQAEIASLQDQIALKQRDMYFEAQQKQIDALQEAANNELERLDAQIDLMTETLAYEKENGLLWMEVRDIMDMAPENIAAFIMQNTQEFWGQSPLQNEQTYRDVLYNCDEWAAYKKEFSNGKSLKDVAESFTDYAIKQDAKIAKAEADSKEYTDVQFNKVRAEIQSLGSSGGGGGDSGGSSSNNNGKSSQQRYGFTTTDSRGYPKSEGGTVYASNSSEATTKAKAMVSQWKDRVLGSVYRYAKGGLANFTGPAWLDGTKSKPESVLTAEQTSTLRNEILGNSPNSLMNLLLDFKNAYNGISGATSSITNNSSGVTIEQAIVEMHVSKIDNDYDAQRAGEQALEKMVQIARKSQGQNRVGR